MNFENTPFSPGNARQKFYYVCKDIENNRQYTIIKLNKHTSTVFDHQHTDKVAALSWHVDANGYIAHSVRNYTYSFMKKHGIKLSEPHTLYLHVYIYKYILGNNIDNTTHSIDHLNWNKFDNRDINLRAATKSEQNSNRATRCDKKEPPEELMNFGIHKLPKHVRYDESQQRFIIEKHPYLNQLVVNGDIKKPIKNGTRKGTLFQQLYDITKIYVTFDEQCKQEEHTVEEENREDDQIYPQRANNFNTLQAIQLAFNKTQMNEKCPSYMNVSVPFDEESSSSAFLQKLDKIAAEHGFTEVKKTKLPEGCGVTPDMIPKYCYFTPETTKRGCCFKIDRHPKMKKRQWSTTSNRDKTIMQKFEDLKSQLLLLESQ